LDLLVVVKLLNFKLWLALTGLVGTIPYLTEKFSCLVN